MQFLCPACSSRYDVDADLLGPGREVRCARCRHIWKVSPAASVVETDMSPSARAVVDAPELPAAKTAPPPALAGPDLDIAGTATAPDHISALALLVVAEALAPLAAERASPEGDPAESAAPESAAAEGETETPPSPEPMPTEPVLAPIVRLAPLPERIDASRAPAELAEIEPIVPAQPGDIVAEVRSERMPPRHRPTRPGRVPTSVRKPRRGRWGGVGLVVTSLCAGMAMVAYKEAVVRVVPTSAIIFADIGLSVNLRGLDLADFHTSLTPAVPAPILSLEGRIANLRDGETAVPMVRIAVRDKDHHELYSWTTRAAKDKLSAGEVLMVRSRLVAPPEGARDVVVSFADPDPVPRTADLGTMALPALRRGARDN